MESFTRILKFIGIIYLILAFGFSILIYLFPNRFLSGSQLNYIVFISSLCAFGLLGILYLIYWITFRPNDDVVINYNRVHVVIYVLLSINVAFCLFGPNGVDQSGLPVTPSYLELGFAALMTLGFYVSVGAQNILKDLSRIGQEGNVTNNS